MNRDDYLYNTFLSMMLNINLVDFVFLKDYNKIVNVKIRDEDARKEVKDEYIDLYKHHVKVDNMKQYIEENVTTYYAISNWDLFVELKNGDKFIYDSFSNAVIFDLYETNELTDEQELKEFARNLKKMIRRSFVTQEELADRIGVNRVSINRYLNGKQIPDSMTLHKIAKALNCSTEDFFYRKY